MSSWKLVQFEELYAEPSKNGLTRPKKVRGSGYKMINMGEIFAYDRIRNPPMELVPLNDKEKKKYCVKTGDLLFARQSLVASGAGKCSIVLETPEITTFESHLIRVRLDSQKTDPLFYFYYFNSPQGKGNIQSLIMQVAAAGIRGSELAKLLVPYPHFPTQHKIAAILFTYDDLIENNLRRIQILKEMIQTIYREWFVNFRFPSNEKVQMIDSPLGEIPESWGVKKLFNVCSIVMGQSPKSEFYNKVGNGLPFHQGVTNFGSRFPVHRVYCTVEKRIADIGDILLSVRAPVGRINIANRRLIVGRGLCAIHNRNGNQWFTFHQLKERFKEEDTMGGGTIFKAITKKEVQEIEFLTPPNLIMQKFEEVCKPIEAQIEILMKKNDNLCHTRDMLLPRLIAGTINVEELEITDGGQENE